MKSDTKHATLALVLLLAGMSLAGHYAVEEDTALEAEHRTVVYVRQPTEAELAMWAAYQREHSRAVEARDRAEMEARARR